MHPKSDQVDHWGSHGTVVPPFQTALQAQDRRAFLSAVDRGLQASILFDSSSASRLVTTNTSCTVEPRRTTTLWPPRIGVETRNFSPGERPFTRAITPGVIVWMASSAASSLSHGIKPST